MRNILTFSTFMLGTFFIFNSQVDDVSAQITPFPLPEFTQTNKNQWINSPPVKKAALEGKVVLIDFWTFDCWNCYRSFPWLNSLERKYRDAKFSVIGIHTPEFEHEKVFSSVKKKTLEFKLTHPVMMDNDFVYWRKLNNKYWPSFYLVDKSGLVRYRFIGETHSDTKKSKAIEDAIYQLLQE